MRATWISIDRLVPGCRGWWRASCRVGSEDHEPATGVRGPAQALGMRVAHTGRGPSLAPSLVPPFGGQEGLSHHAGSMCSRGRPSCGACGGTARHLLLVLAAADRRALPVRLHPPQAAAPGVAHPPVAPSARCRRLRRPCVLMVPLITFCYMNIAINMPVDEAPLSRPASSGHASQADSPRPPTSKARPPLFRF